MGYFPFYYDITGRTFLVIGGGKVAEEKVERLRRFTDAIIVIAPRTQIRGVRILQREYRGEDLALGDFVVAATGIRELDRKIAAQCRERGIPVNTVDDQEYCDYIFPSIIKRGDLTVAISTSGTSPAYAMQLRKEIEEILPPEIGGTLERMGGLRGEVAGRIPDQAGRAACYRALLAALIGSGNRLTDEEIEKIIGGAAKKLREQEGTGGAGSASNPCTDNG